MFLNIIRLGLSIGVIFKLSQQCEISSFENVIVQIKESTTEYKIVADGCIAAKHLKNESQLKEISIKKQNVPDLSKGAIMNISSHFRIIFHENELDIIREKSFLNLPGVTEIDLSQNKINWIGARAFTNLESLEEINLMNNNIETIAPRCFNNLPKLSEVNLRFNKLESFDEEWFYDTPFLRRLWLRDNRIRSVQKGAFINFPNLVELHLDKNGLETLDKDAFKGLRKLERIYFSENNLKKFDVNFHTPSKIIFMSLHYNNITYIADGTLDAVKTSMTKIWITGNPLQCACFDKMSEWGVDNKITVAWMCKNRGTVCVVPKTDPKECKERTDDDFAEGFSKNFGNFKSCEPGADY